MSPALLQHSLSIEGGEIACLVALRAAEGRDGAEIVITPLGAETKAIERETRAPLLSGFAPDAARLRSAAQWIVDIDFGAQLRLAAGASVAKYLAAGDPDPLPDLPLSAGESAYRRVSPAAGTLVRPLLLPSPDLSRLFPYQQIGVEWLVAHNHGILADDMGLGKTVQVIAALRSLIRAGVIRSALVIAPRSMLATWARELTAWAPELVRIRVMPQAKERDGVWRAVTGHVHVAITSYEQIREPAVALVSSPVDLVIADEAHRIRNVSSQVTRGFQQVDAKRVWTLTGTPIERDAEDMATLLSLIDPRRFSPADSRDPPSVLRARARPYLLRRVKAEVLDELPEVLERVEVLDLLPAQQRTYDRVLRRVGREHLDTDDTLQVVNELRSICDADPTTGISAKIDRIVEILDDICATGEKAVVFSILLRPLELLGVALTSRPTPIGYRSIIGEMTMEERDNALQAFKQDADVTALLASSRVAGEGLTLTEANHVLFVNEWWNPSANAQARDRVVRIGQRRGVHVYSFRSAGTIEMDLARIIERKASLFGDVVGKLSVAGAASDPQVRELLAELQAGDHADS